MLEIGKKVVYQHRVCTVTGIREAYIDGRDYYELEALYERALKLFIFVTGPKPRCAIHIAAQLSLPMKIACARV